MRKLSFLQLHTTVFIPGGIGELKVTLPPDNKTFRRFDMYEDGDKIVISAESERGLKQEILIPLTNVKLALYAELSKPSTSKVSEEG